jgi:hypothetical protein
MERRDPVVRDGKTWHRRAAGGKEGIGRVAVWLEVMELPSGRRTERGSVAGTRLVTGPETWT